MLAGAVALSGGADAGVSTAAAKPGAGLTKAQILNVLKFVGDYWVSVFLSDTMGFMNEKLRVDAGIRQTAIKRDYTNYANEGTGQAQLVAHHADPEPNSR